MALADSIPDHPPRSNGFTRPHDDDQQLPKLAVPDALVGLVYDPPLVKPKLDFRGIAPYPRGNTDVKLSHVCKKKIVNSSPKPCRAWGNFFGLCC